MLPHTFITFIQLLLNYNKCGDRILSYSTKQLHPSYTAASTFFLLTVQINRLPRVFFLTLGYLTYEIYILSQGGDGKQPKDNSKEVTICLMFMTNKLNKFYLTSAGLTASHFLFLYSRGVKEGRKAPKKRIDIFL